MIEWMLSLNPIGQWCIIGIILLVVAFVARAHNNHEQKKHVATWEVIKL